MRPVFLFLALVVASTALRAAGPEFVRVWPGWRPAESFDRISEYFDGQENTGKNSVLRTQPASRAGYYFLVRLKKGTTAPEGSKFALTVIGPDAPEPKVFTFPVTGAPPRVFELGLTGSDWPNRETHPVAWKLELLSAEGASLAETQSFLWAMPAK